MKEVYIAGDIMSYGSQMEAKRIEEILERKGIPFYSARLNKEINDKKNQTQESNDHLAEQIVEQDNEVIHRCHNFIINYNPHAVGTLIEMGQIYNLWLQAQEITIPTINIIVLCDDIRRTDIPEVGDRRSWSINQYAYGVILDMTHGRGITPIDELEEAVETWTTEES